MPYTVSVGRTTRSPLLDRLDRRSDTAVRSASTGSRRASRGASLPRRARSACGRPTGGKRSRTGPPGQVPVVRHRRRSRPSARAAPAPPRRGCRRARCRASRRGAAAPRPGAITGRITARPSAPPNTASAGSCPATSGGDRAPLAARTAGCTAPRPPRRPGRPAAAGSVTSPSTTSTDVPRRPARPRCAAARPARPGTAPPRSPGPPAARAPPPARSRPSRCTGRPPPGRPGAGACAIPSRPAAPSPAAGTKTPGPTASSRCRNAARPSQMLQRLAPARRATNSSNRAPLVAGQAVGEGQPAPGHPEHVRGQQLGVDPGRADPGGGERYGRRGPPRATAARVPVPSEGCSSEYGARHNHEASPAAPTSGCVQARTDGRFAGGVARPGR